MKVYSSNQIRNVVILGHTGSGKTAFVEAALHIAGHTSRLGRTADGNTISDYDPEEVSRGISISASVTPVEWKDTKINFIDTPGFFDFDGEVRQALRVADLALIMVNAKSGIEVGTEKAWEYCFERKLPTIFFVNGIDDENANYESIVDQLKEKVGKNVAPIQVPFKEGGKFKGYVNAIKREGRTYVNGKTEECGIPDGMHDEVERERKMIEEAVAEVDDELMEKFFAGEEFSVKEIQKAMKKGIIEGVVYPVFVGTAYYEIGIRVLMNTIIDILPPVSELCRDIQATKNGVETVLTCDEAGPFVARVFKTISDPFVGKLSLFKVYSGVLKKDTPLYNVSTNTSEKINSLSIMRGKEQTQVSEIRAGDIGAIAKLSNTSTGDTLCTKLEQFTLQPIGYPQPLYSLGIVSNGKGDEDKISQALAKILEEDKTLKMEVNKETKQTVLSGLGDSHLDVVINKLKSKYKLDVKLVPLVVPYRETIKGTAKDIRGKHKKQSGGSGQFGDVLMSFESSGDLATAYVFEEKIHGGTVPKQYFPAVEKGLQESVLAGPLAGYPVVGLKATLTDGSYHAVDSNELAFKLATIIAFKEGFMQAKPVLLEPIARVEILIPDEYTGDIMGDINKRRGRILGMTKSGEKQQISAQVPYVEMVTYAIDLRSITQGRGSYELEFDQYEEVPKEAADKIIAGK